MQHLLSVPADLTVDSSDSDYADVGYDSDWEDLQLSAVRTLIGQPEGRCLKLRLFETTYVRHGITLSKIVFHFT